MHFTQPCVYPHWANCEMERRAQARPVSDLFRCCYLIVFIIAHKPSALCGWKCAGRPSHAVTKTELSLGLTLPFSPSSRLHPNSNMWFATDSGPCCTRRGRHLQTLLISHIWRELSAPLAWTSQHATAVVSDNPNSTYTLRTSLRYWAISFNFPLRTPLTEPWEFWCQELIFFFFSRRMQRP